MQNNIYNGYQNPINLNKKIPDVQKRKSIKHAVSKSSVLVMACVIAMQTIFTIFVVILRRVPEFTTQNNEYAGIHAVLYYSIACLSYLIAIGIIPICVLKFGKSDINEALCFDKCETHGITKKELFFIGCIGMSLGLLANFPTDLVQYILNFIGFDGSVSDMPVSRSFSVQLLYFVYGTAIPPLVEEILFRGAAINYLKKYGEWFAIIITSILFAFYHMNITQGVFTFLFGMILGYLRIRTGSLLLPMILHMLNNGFVSVSVIAQQCFGGYAMDICQYIYFGVTFAFGIYGLIYLIIKNKSVFLFENKASDERLETSKSFIYGIISVGFLIFLGYFVFNVFFR